MDLEKSLLLLESLFDRIERDADAKWKLGGAISTQERDALRFVLQHLGVNLPTEASGQPVSGPALLPEISLNTHAASLQSAEDQQVIMCVDFGTAMSKAFAIHAEDGRPIDLAVGRQSGFTEAVYPMPSTVYISGTGRVFLGQEAITQSLQDSTPERERFDSPKQELSQGSMGDLADVLVPQSVNPTGVPLTKEELITLYLAFLTDMACAELSKRHGLSRYVRRRFAMPCWTADRTEWAERLLKRMLARAQVLADTFNGQWHGGIDIKKVRAAFNKLDSVGIPVFLIAEGVKEPVAAASSRMIQGEPQRRGFLVVDIGAGTTDFGLFVLVEGTAPRAKMFQIPGSIHGIRQAGDTIDNILRAAILTKHNVDLQSAYGKRIGAELGLRIRQFKETLFRDGALRYALADDTTGELTLDAFLQRDEIARFNQALEQELKKTLDEIDQSWVSGIFSRQGLVVVLTGGGARLPMVKELTRGVVECQGLRIERQAAAEIPAWIEAQYPEFAAEYPQLAVAMGGASPSLPEMGPEVERFAGGLPQPTYQAGNLPLKGI